MRGNQPRAGNATSDAKAIARQTIETHSKSFALASKLLGHPARDRAVVVYAWCRRADDAVDSVGPDDATTAVRRLDRELEVIFSDGLTGDPILDAFGEVARETGMPKHYPAELLAGMAMDAEETDYQSWQTLFHYCYRVAGTVGLMMSHVMGLSRPQAMVNATHLGIGMQLTNICRDIREDWDRGRIYLPDELLAEVGYPELGAELRARRGRPLGVATKKPLALAIERVLAVADAFYRSGDQGVSALPPRGRWAVSAARAIYSDIGRVVRARGCDVFAPRAVVSNRRKLRLAASAAPVAAKRLGRDFRASAEPLPLITFPDGVNVEQVLAL